MLQHSATARSSILLAALAGLACSSVAMARDEDDMKLKHKLPRYEGLGFINGQWLGGSFGDDPDGPFDSHNMELLSWLSLPMFPNNQGSGNDLWGYVSPSGREYIIMGLEKGFSFVEVTDPRNPRIVGNVTGPTSLWHDVAIIGSYAYGVSEGGSGIQVMDMTRIDEGVVTHVLNKTQAGHSRTHTILANEETGFLYLCGTNVNNGGLTAVATRPSAALPAASPTNPLFAGAWTTEYVHECLPISYTSGPLAGREVVYVFDGSRGLKVVDVTDKAAMTTIGSLVYPDTFYCHQGWLSTDQRYLYVNDELDEQNGGVATLTRVIDVSDPRTPTLITSFGNGITAIDHNLYVKGDMIFEGNYTTGLRVWDNTNPIAPTEIAWIDTHPEGNTTTFNGVWGNYPYLPSGTLALADIERGLILARINFENVAMSLVGQPPATLPPNVAVAVEINAAPSGGAVLPAGNVKLHVRVDGGAEQQIALSQAAGGEYEGAIPGASCFATVDFWFSATTATGRTFTLPTGGGTTPYSAQVLTGSVEIASEAFEVANAGWAGTYTGDNATAGRWNRMDPQPTAAQPGDDHTAAPGVNCWVTDGVAGAQIGERDVDGGRTTLVSPVLDLSATAEAKVGYWRWYSNSAGASPNADTFRVDITNNNGTSWVNAETVGPSGAGTSGGWIYHEFRVADFVAPSAQVRVRWVAEDIGSGSIVEAAVDDFRVFAAECQSCYADCDTSTGGGTLDIFDFLCFQNKFAANEPYACECDTSTGPGVCDIFDFLCFQNAFAAGCP